MSKFDDGDPSSDERKTRKALEKFFEAEAHCARTNHRFAKYFLGHRPDDPGVARVICNAREKIWRLFENVPINDLVRDSTFTNGGSVKLPRACGSSVHKYSSALETTVTNQHALSQICTAIPLWEASLAQGPGINVVPGNKLTCVPKNYKVHRVIAGEPSGNMYIQKGIHAFLRRKLREVGIDLSNQVTNQDWARFGSVTGAVATIDMSMASDTVSKTVVEWFVPEDLLLALETVRSPVGQFADGTKVLYRKFSSMGNATTFEVETLLFWALATAACDVSGADRHFVGVYGDDVIIPTRAVPLFLSSLEECGFIPNKSKTFVSGPFRESCGKHYLNGEDVSPFYIRHAVRTLPDLFKVVNNLERWRRRVVEIHDCPSWVDGALRRVINDLRDFAPASWRRPRIPDGKGDGAFIGTFDECLPNRPFGKRKWFEGWQVEVLTERRNIALGVVFDTNGLPRPLLRNSAGRYEVGPVEKSMHNVTLEGYLLSKLEKAERRNALWYQVIRRSTPRVAAMLFQRWVDGSESEPGIPYGDPTWVTTTMIVAQF
jgi:hypothetical protein